MTLMVRVASETTDVVRSLAFVDSELPSKRSLTRHCGVSPEGSMWMCKYNVGAWGCGVVAMFNFRGVTVDAVT